MDNIKLGSEIICIKNKGHFHDKVLKGDKAIIVDKEGPTLILWFTEIDIHEQRITGKMIYDYFKITK